MIDNLAEAERLVQQTLTERAKYIGKLERYVLGTQYEGRPDFFTDSSVPLWERAPCVVYPIVQSSIDSYLDLILGEGRAPVATSRQAWDSDNEELDEATAKEMDKAFVAAATQARLHSLSREALASAMGCTSACVVFGVRKARLFGDTIKPQWCTPELDSEGACIQLEIKYPFIDFVKLASGHMKAVAKLYRRTIDSVADIIYKPAEIRDGMDESKINWVVQDSVNHGLGFCPVIWYARQKGCSVVGRIDGHAIHECLLDEIDALNFALSQRHRAALYAGDPQWTEVGVEAGYNPTSPGRPAVVAKSTPYGGLPSEGNPLHNAGYIAQGQRTNKVRKKSPGIVWQYENPEAKVELHCLPGDALEALDNHAQDLRAKLAESMGVVFIDPENLPTGALSGVALENLRARQIARCDQERADFGDKFLLPAYAMLLRIAMVKGLKLPGIDKLAAKIGELGEAWSWHCPPIELIWGSYRQPSPEEQLQKAQMATALQTAGIATKRVLVRMLRDVMGIEDVDAYMDELEKESEKADEQEVQKADAMAKVEAKHAPPRAPGAK